MRSLAPFSRWHATSHRNLQLSWQLREMEDRFPARVWVCLCQAPFSWISPRDAAYSSSHPSQKTQAAPCRPGGTSGVLACGKEFPPPCDKALFRSSMGEANPSTTKPNPLVTAECPSGPTMLIGFLDLL